jgi:hypothetical protein
VSNGRLISVDFLILGQLFLEALTFSARHSEFTDSGAGSGVAAVRVAVRTLRRKEKMLRRQGKALRDKVRMFKVKVKPLKDKGRIFTVRSENDQSENDQSESENDRG